MKTVFIGGSRKLSRLNEQIRSKLAEITERKLHVLVGDANGADRAVQAQLRDWGYESVTVFFVGSAPRNNEGAWPTERVAVYVSKQRRFRNVRSEAELRELSSLDRSERASSESEAHPELPLGVPSRGPTRKRRRRAV